MIVPDFYGRFCCKAGECRHSCCRGWEIDIDAATAARYRDWLGELGERLCASMVQEQGVWHFMLTETGDCPFLRPDGLCQLIRTAGEDILCTICREHPRFYKQVNGVEIAGVGLACEKSVELLLEVKAPLQFGEAAGTGVAAAGEYALSGLLAKLGLDCLETCLRWQPDFTVEYISFVLDMLAMTEPIDAAWTEELAALQQDVSGAAAHARMLAAHGPDVQLQWLYQYIFYRQLDRLAEYGTGTLAAYAACGVITICLLAVRRGLPDAIRRWSEQIEYSPDNVTLLLEIA